MKLITDFIAKCSILHYYRMTPHNRQHICFEHFISFLRLVAASLRKNRSLIYLDLERYSVTNIN